METKELIEYLKSILPEKVDYVEMVGAECFAYGCRYVYEDEYGYMLEATIDKLKKLEKIENEIKDDGVF